jgi:hypothetical protein
LVGIDAPQSLLVRQKEEPIMGNDIVIAVDVAKSAFEVGVSERPGHVGRRERLRREQFLPLFLAYPGATLVMEPRVRFISSLDASRPRFDRLHLKDQTAVARDLDSSTYHNRMLHLGLSLPKLSVNTSLPTRAADSSDDTLRPNHAPNVIDDGSSRVAGMLALATDGCQGLSTCTNPTEQQKERQFARPVFRLSKEPQADPQRSCAQEGMEDDQLSTASHLVVPPAERR